MRKEKYIVTEDAVRPAGSPGECFYCNVPLGAEHKHGCVMRQRTVVVRTTIEHVISVPEDWDAAMIEFSRNEGSRCSDNDIGDLQEMVSRMEIAGHCTCAMTNTTFLCEATDEDEEACAWGEDIEEGRD